MRGSPPNRNLSLSYSAQRRQVDAMVNPSSCISTSYLLAGRCCPFLTQSRAAPDSHPPLPRRNSRCEDPSPCHGLYPTLSSPTPAAPAGGRRPPRAAGCVRRPADSARPLAGGRLVQRPPRPQSPDRRGAAHRSAAARLGADGPAPVHAAVGRRAWRPHRSRGRRTPSRGPRAGAPSPCDTWAGRRARPGRGGGPLTGRPRHDARPLTRNRDSDTGGPARPRGPSDGHGDGHGGSRRDGGAAGRRGCDSDPGVPLPGPGPDRARTHREREGGERPLQGDGGSAHREFLQGRRGSGSALLCSCCWCSMLMLLLQRAGGVGSV
jgi:hypothetical protein